MIDIEIIRTDPDRLREAYGKRHDTEALQNLEKIIELDKQMKGKQKKIDDTRHRIKENSRLIGQLKSGMDISKEVILQSLLDLNDKQYLEFRSIIEPYCDGTFSDEDLGDLAQVVAEEIRRIV